VIVGSTDDWPRKYKFARVPVDVAFLRFSNDRMGFCFFVHVLKMKARRVSSATAGSEHDGTTVLISEESRNGNGNHVEGDNISEGSESGEMAALERKLVRKVDLRLCTIAGILCSLNLVDSGLISSASVSEGFFEDLGLGVGNRYVSEV